MVLLFALFWAALASWRIRVLIRFFQLEEYQSARYIRWLVASRHRAVPDRFLLGATAGFAVAGILLVVGLDAAALHLPVWLVAGAVIAWPEPAKEVKKRFVATQRATRLLVTAWAVAILWHVGFGILVASQTDAVNATTLEIVALAGLAGYVLAPLALPVANVLMYPVEETFRRGFREKARRRLARARPLSIIGITGSYGKTSTKDYIAHLLSGRHKVLATPKSYNTLMGVCITINNNLDPDGGYEYF
ncbi:MAG: hypothetical protein GYB66_13400, partial [Chloroflexi bacterium]|nr:hypothetical protein [Chloroflexota bacterium]